LLFILKKEKNTLDAKTFKKYHFVMNCNTNTLENLATEHRWEKLEGHQDAFEGNVEFLLESGQSSNSMLSIAFTFMDWSTAHYLLLPGAVYDGNRFNSYVTPYPPMYPNLDDRQIDMPITITDVPRLNLEEGISQIHMLTGDLSTPSVGMYSPKTNTGCILLFEQQTSLGQTGIRIRENEHRDRLEVELQLPGVRSGFIYKNCNLKGTPSPDQGSEIQAGDRINCRYRIYFFRAPRLQTLFDTFFLVRKDFSDHALAPHSIPFSQAWDIQESAYNSRWNEKGNYYPCLPAKLLDFQIGWVGGAMAAYALFVEGGELSKQRVRLMVDRIVTTMQSESGLFLSSGKDEAVYSDGIWGSWPNDMHAIRKSGDALYFFMKMLIFMRKQGELIPEAWGDAFRRMADAFVQIWEKYGQFGQFININTGDIIIGGSSAGGIAPAALALSYVWYGDERYLQSAESAATYYYEKDVLMGVTTGAPSEILQCPDSESAYALFDSFITLYEVTGKQHWLDVACEMAHQCATWNVSYNYRFPEKSEFARLEMHTLGSVIANVQNKHSAPGICTLSGDAWFKLYRYTRNPLYMSMIKETAHHLPLYLSRDDRPILSWDKPPKQLPAGMMCERVNMSDWEGREKIGEVFYGITWPEISNMLAYTELPGIYIDPQNREVHVLDHVEAQFVDDSSSVCLIQNPTAYHAVVKVFVENAANPWFKLELFPGEKVYKNFM
jgi:hypothetical protein